MYFRQKALSLKTGLQSQWQEAHKGSCVFTRYSDAKVLTRPAVSRHRYESGWGHLHKEYVESARPVNVRWSLKMENPEEDSITYGESAPETQQLQEQRSNLSCQWVERSLTTLHVWISKVQQLPCLSVDSSVFCTSTVFTRVTCSMHCSATQKRRLKGQTKGVRRAKRIKGGQQDERETLLRPEDNLARVTSVTYNWPKNSTMLCHFVLKHFLIFIWIYRLISLGLACLLVTTTNALVHTKR